MTKAVRPRTVHTYHGHLRTLFRWLIQEGIIAVTFLRNGGNVFSLQQILGHTSLQMTNRYVAVSQGDLEKQHRQFSPVDRMGGQ